MSGELVYAIVIGFAVLYWIVTVYQKQQAKIKLKEKLKNDFGKKISTYYDEKY